ncbi:MAG: cbb3-type cytochrome c oxidase subunit 3 [Caulobacter sp.]|nr:cbb3-type cytochrome c oxidase subunit 3 [Caulobacter sp.]
MTYEIAASFAQQGGLIYFGLIFLAGCAYAFWPKNRDEFVRAANLPLEEDDQ